MGLSIEIVLKVGALVRARQYDYENSKHGFEYLRSWSLVSTNYIFDKFLSGGAIVVQRCFVCLA